MNDTNPETPVVPVTPSQENATPVPAPEAPSQDNAAPVPAPEAPSQDNAAPVPAPEAPTPAQPMNPVQAKEKLREYASIKSQIKQFEKEAKKMQPEILEIIGSLNPQEEDHKVSTDFGFFSSVPKRKYSYSLETQTLLDQAKAEQKREEQDGTATYEVNPYLKFDAPRSAKPDDDAE